MPANEVMESRTDTDSAASLIRRCLPNRSRGPGLDPSRGMRLRLALATSRQGRGVASSRCQQPPGKFQIVWLLGMPAGVFTLVAEGNVYLIMCVSELLLSTTVRLADLSHRIVCIALDAREESDRDRKRMTTHRVGGLPVPKTSAGPSEPVISGGKSSAPTRSLFLQV